MESFFVAQEPTWLLFYDAHDWSKQELELGRVLCSESQGQLWVECSEAIRLLRC